MRPSNSGSNIGYRPDKGMHQNFFTNVGGKGQLAVNNPNFVAFKEKMMSKNAQNSRTPSNKKSKSNIAVKSFGGSVVQNQIGKVRVSSGGRTKPGATNQPDKQLKHFLTDQEKSKRKSGGGSHSRNHIFQVTNGSNTGRSYNKSNTREYSPHNVSKSPKQNKKSRNSRIAGSQTHIATKRRQSKKYSKDQDAFKTIKNLDKSKKDSIFLMYQQYPKMTKTGPVGSNTSRGANQFSALSPKTVKNMIKTSSGAISGFDKYQLNPNPSKHSELKNPSDRKLANYLNSLASEGTKSKEDLRYVPVENISLFDEASAPLSARNPRNTGSMKQFAQTSTSKSLSNLKTIKYFKAIKVFKKWAGYVRRKKYLEKRQQVADKLAWAKPYF
jgi:hypothetical protein